jgi:hypothetical protein
MLERTVPILFLLFGLFSFGKTAHALIIFDDGLTHIIDAANSIPADDVLVRNGTTVNVVAGGQVGGNISLAIPGGNTLNVSGGTVGSIRGGAGGGDVFVSDGTIGSILLDDTDGFITGGNIDTVSVSSDSVGNLTIAGGVITSVTSASAGLLTVTDGEIIHLASTHGGRLEFSGGLVSTLFQLGLIENLATISGGTVQGTIRNFGGDLEISGGQVSASIDTGTSATTVITGGFMGPSILIGANPGGDIPGGSVIVSGSGFNLPLGEVTALSGTLTGVLTDGTVLNSSFDRCGGGCEPPHLSAGVLTLIPEPSTAALLGLGLVGFAATRRRNRG